jgi:hypothetical protein
VPFEGADGHQQRAPGGAEFGPHLETGALGVLRFRGAGRERQGDGGEPRIPCPAAARPVHQVRGDAEHHGGRLHDPPLQQAQQMGAGSFGVCAVVQRDDERGASAAERERGAEGGVQAVRMDEVGVGAGGSQRGHGAGVAAARHLHMVGAGAPEVVGVLGLDGGAHGDPHAPRDQSRRERAHMRAAAGVATAQHLHGAQRQLAVR